MKIIFLVNESVSFHVIVFNFVKPSVVTIYIVTSVD